MNCGICVVPLKIFLFRFAHGNQFDVMIQWMLDGLDCRILIFMKGNSLAALTIKVVLECGLWIFR